MPEAAPNGSNLDLDKLDPGIREAVRILHDSGIDTLSRQSRMPRAWPFPLRREGQKIPTWATDAKGDWSWFNYSTFAPPATLCYRIESITTT